MLILKNYKVALFNTMKRSLIILLTILILASCGSNPAKESVDGHYVYQDGISRSEITISDGYWRMKTQFGAPGYYGSDAKYDSGEVKGNTLYHSRFIPYGTISKQTLTIGSRRYRKQ